MPAALAGIRVIDLTSHISGPYCTMLLADLGADVIKIERPQTGDDARRMPPFVDGEGAPFMLVNRNKRSMALDLKQPDQAQFLRDLVGTADVMIENFKPGTLDRMGLDAASMRALYPRLVYCSISGFGQTGPLHARGGFDLMMQAMSGLMSVCGDSDGPPHRLPVPISDISAGMFATIGILAALNARNTSGEGQVVDTSLFESAVAFGVYEAAGFFATGKPPERIGQAHRGSAPYEVLRTADGWLTVGGATQPLWTKLCAILGAPELAQDARFADNASRVRNRRELIPILQEYFQKATNAEWSARLEQAGIPMGPVLTFDEVLTHEQIIARGVVEEIDHPVTGRTRALNPPFKLSGTPTRIRRPAPRLGQHNEEIRAEFKEMVKPAS